MSRENKSFPDGMPPRENLQTVCLPQVFLSVVQQRDVGQGQPPKDQHK